MSIAIIACGALVAPHHASAGDPPALGKAVAVNDALPRAVVAGVTQAAAATTPEATAARIGFFTTTATDSTLKFQIVSQTSAVPAPGLSTSTAVYLLTADGGTYRAATLADGTFGVSQSVNGAWNPIGTATFAVDGQVTEIDVQAGAWTAPGTTIVVIRRDLDSAMNGFESATPPILLDALSSTGFGGSIPLLAHGTALGTDGLTNTPCAIVNMPTVSLDPDTEAVTFTFASPPAADLRATVGGVSLADLVNPPYISGRFGDAVWTGTRQGASIGDFAVTSAGTTVTVATSNDSGSIFQANHRALTIGISDPTGCYSLSPAVPLALLLTAAGQVPTAPTSIGAATTVVATTVPPGSTASSVPSAATSTAVATTSHETFANNDKSTPWTAIIIVGVLAVLAGIGGGMLITRRDRRRSEARDALFTPRRGTVRGNEQAGVVTGPPRDPRAGDERAEPPFAGDDVPDDEPDDEPGDGLSDEPDDDSTDEPADEPADEPWSEPADEPADETWNEPADD